jgi:CheY-like chemotaxis protein
MRLDRLTPAHVRRAVNIYLEHAWPAGRPERPVVDLRKLDAASSTAEVLAVFDKPRPVQGTSCEHYTLRLGNWRYPFMKLALQEYLVRGEYFFSVDTHDDLKISPEMPDYDGWQEIRRFNRGLKLEIESAWERADLPTYEKLRELMEGLAELEREGTKRARLLLVDDERSVVRGLATALNARGYEVEIAFDGEQVLERLARDPLPDLLLLDYAMPGVDGETVLAQVRANPRSRNLPVLLATASTIDLGAIQRSCGLLLKPYPREVLFTMIAELLARSRAG